MTFIHHMPTKLFFGRGELSRLSTEPLPGQKALIVMSAGGSMTRQGYLQKVTAALDIQQTPFVIFDKIQPNPTLQSVRDGSALAKTEGCDFVIGLGGGSSIDAAKSIAVMMTNPGDYWDYISGGSGKERPLAVPAAPMIAITTTAGTGTESDPWTVVTKEETGEKIGFGHESTYPYFSIIDSSLMDTVPPHLTAFQGFDALFHSTEGYISNKASAMSDLYSSKAIELVGCYLPRAVADGSDAEARDGVALANTLSGFVESISSCTSEHAIEHAMSGFFPALPHGAGLIMISLEYYKMFGPPQEGCERLSDMAKLLSGGISDDFVATLTKLQSDCGVDNLKMSDYGIKIVDAKKIALHSFDTMGGLYENDRRILSADDVAGIIERSYK